MKLRVKSSDEFRNLMARLARDINNAHVHWRMYENLHDALGAQSDAYTLSPAFWSLTLDAHRETAVLHLCRAFDSQPEALSFSTWLGAIRNHLPLFDIETFDKGMVDNPFRHTLRDHAMRPDLEQLSVDEARCSSSDATVKKLLRFRGHVAAHTSAKGARDGNILTLSPAPECHEIEDLLPRAAEVLTRYSLLVSAELFPTSILGARLSTRVCGGSSGHRSPATDYDRASGHGAAGRSGQVARRRTAAQLDLNLVKLLAAMLQEPRHQVRTFRERAYAHLSA